jgi:hypothetical protein
MLALLDNTTAARSVDTVDGHLTSDPGSRESEHDARHYGRYGR